MSRAGSSDTIVLKPTVNVYTGLTGVAVLVSLLALFVVYRQAGSLFGGLMSADASSTSTR